MGTVHSAVNLTFDSPRVWAQQPRIPAGFPAVVVGNSLACMTSRAVPVHIKCCDY